MTLASVASVVARSKGRLRSVGFDWSIVIGVAATVIAGAELWRAFADGRRHTRRLRARRTAESFALRRQIRAWLGEEPLLRRIGSSKGIWRLEAR